MAVSKITGAPSTGDHWCTINWDTAETQVKRLQMRIAKATKEKRYGRAKALQWVLTHSFSAKALAVKRVTDNRGSKTAGVDGLIWKTPNQKMVAVKTLQRRGYQSSPLRRIYIPKRNGKQRPLGIPTMVDRAQQALHLFALEPVAETMADRNSYGFRPHRSCADAIEQCFSALAKKTSAQWILEGDIKSCFDKISHEWLIQHTLMDTKIMRQWLKSGFIHEEQWYETEEGTPQGGIISPTLANLALDGMEGLLRSLTVRGDKVNLIRYADDFVITGSSKELLEEKIKPALIAFLSERGLSLSAEKTHITHIRDGFDFLGFNIRKYKGKLLTKPSKKNVLAFLANIREIIKTGKGKSALELLRQLNPKIRGWANYYRSGVSKETFQYVDSQIFKAIWRWCKCRHPNKNQTWIKEKYFTLQGNRNWMMTAKFRNKDGKWKTFSLVEASYIPIVRHIKIKAEANPYDARYANYFEQRSKKKKDAIFSIEPYSGYH